MKKAGKVKISKGATGVGGKKNPNPVFNAVVKKPGGRVGGTNKSVKVNPVSAKGGNKK